VDGVVEYSHLSAIILLQMGHGIALTVVLVHSLIVQVFNGKLLLQEKMNIPRHGVNLQKSLPVRNGYGLVILPLSRCGAKELLVGSSIVYNIY
jgi:hypothetical protein